MREKGGRKGARKHTPNTLILAPFCCDFSVGSSFLLLSNRICPRGGGLPREGVGAKKFGMSLETQGSQTFFGGSEQGLKGKEGGKRGEK